MKEEGAGRSGSLDLVRTIASVMVFVVHFRAVFLLQNAQPSMKEISDLLGYLHSHGSSMLLVLSGYFTARSAAKGTAYVDFVAKRFWRLAPSYYAVLALYGLAYGFYPARSRLPSSLAESIAYVGANVLMLPGVFPIQPMITVTWTLSYIMLAAILFPPVYRLLNMRAHPCWARCAIYVSLMVLIAWSGAPVWSLLLLGGLVAELQGMPGEKRPEGGRLALASVICVGGCVAAACFRFDGNPAIAWMTLGAFLLLMARWRRVPWTEAFSRGLAQVSQRTYAFYLSHGLVLNVLFILAEDGRVNSLSSLVLWFALSLCVAGLMACLLYEVVERPFAKISVTEAVQSATWARRKFDGVL